MTKPLRHPFFNWLSCLQVLNTQNGFSFFACKRFLILLQRPPSLFFLLHDFFVSFYLLLLFTFQWWTEIQKSSSSTVKIKKTLQSWLLSSQQTCVSDFSFFKGTKIGEIFHCELNLFTWLEMSISSNLWICQRLLFGFG